jgi:hypothetical protein
MTAPTIAPFPLRAAPEPQVGLFMFPTEAFRGNWRSHWLRPTWRLIAGALVVALMVLGQTDQLGNVGLDYSWHPIDSDIGDVPALGGGVTLWVLWALWTLVAWRRRIVALTDCRLILVTGVLSRRVSGLPAALLSHSGLRQTLLGRVFGYGTLVTSAIPLYQPMARIRHVPTPRYAFVRMVEECCEPAAAESRRTPIPAEPAPRTEPLAITRGPSYTDGGSDDYPATAALPDFDPDRPIYRIPRHRAKPIDGSDG